MIPIQRNSRLDTKFGILANEGVAFGNLDKRYKTISEGARLKNREAMISSLLLICDDADDCTENFLEEDIKYEELAMLSNKDLELLGIKSENARAEILSTLKEIQNQERTFDEIIKHRDADKFNSHIFERVVDHLTTMSSSISAANYKLRLNPPNNVVVDDKFYASKYVLETLDEIKKVTNQVDKQLKNLEKFTKPKESVFIEVSAVIAIIGIAVGFWAWRRK